MIISNTNTQLKSVLQFKPETGELAGHIYNIRLLVCSNPTCDCGFTKMEFRNKEDEDETVAVLDANVHEETVDLPEEYPPLSDYIKGYMEAGMSELDWETLQRGYYLYKNILSENFDVKSLDVKFPENLIRERNLMQAYTEYLPASEIFQVTNGENTYLMFDYYCINPECFCTELHFEIFKEEKHEGSIFYDYKSHETVWRKTTLPKPFAEELIYGIHHAHPDLDDKLNRRNGNLRALFAKFLMKKGTPTHAVPKMPVKKKTVGRNDPCPCGSGKKYKRCCGK